MENTVLSPQSDNVEKSKVKVARAKKMTKTPHHKKDNTDINPEPASGIFNDTLEYQVDWLQRSVLYLDTYRKLQKGRCAAGYSF